MKAERNIYNVMMVAIKAERVPDRYHGPKTMFWATAEGCRDWKLTDFPLVHLDADGRVDCHFTETTAVIVQRPGIEESPFDQARDQQEVLDYVLTQRHGGPQKRSVTIS
jgi:hypothetical protein